MRKHEDYGTDWNLLVLWICIILVGIVNIRQNSKIRELQSRVDALAASATPTAQGGSTDAR